MAFNKWTWVNHTPLLLTLFGTDVAFYASARIPLKVGDLKVDLPN